MEKYSKPEEAFNEKQMELLRDMKFVPMYQKQTKEFMFYKKQYGPPSGSYLFVHPVVQKHSGNQIVMDRNVFAPDHNECYHEHQKLRASGLFI